MSNRDVRSIVIDAVVNGRGVRAQVEPRQMLADFLREDLGLRGVKISCEVQVCGSCTVLLDDAPVSACSTLAAEADGRTVTTIEGLSDGDRFDHVQKAFVQASSLACGYCTPGMILTVRSMLMENPAPSEGEIMHFLQGNICRCGTYAFVMSAVTSLCQNSQDLPRSGDSGAV